MSVHVARFTKDEFADLLGLDSDENIEIINIQYNTHPIVVYASHYKQALPLNLLQHAYNPQKQGGIAWRRCGFIFNCFGGNKMHVFNVISNVFFQCKRNSA